jgi:hypothetical protein
MIFISTASRLTRCPGLQDGRVKATGIAPVRTMPEYCGYQIKVATLIWRCCGVVYNNDPLQYCPPQ